MITRSQLGCLNATLSFWSPEALDATAVRDAFARSVRAKLDEKGARVTHLTLTATGTTVLVALEAELSPDELSAVFDAAVAESPHGLSLDQLECFAPQRSAQD